MQESDFVESLRYLGASQYEQGKFGEAPKRTPHPMLDESFPVRVSLEVENKTLAPSFSDDGRYVACGRANQLQVYHVATGRMVSQPIDTALASGELYKERGAAHLDIIQSLAFHPSGDLFASGGFRNVKLWRRGRNVRLSEGATEDAVRSLLLVHAGKSARPRQSATAERRTRRPEAEARRG